MNSAAYDVAYYIANTLGKGTLGTDVFCNAMPISPENAISVYQYGGAPSAKGMGSDTQPLEHASLQIDVRNSDPSQVESIIQDIFEAFDEIGVDVTINGTVYTYFNPMQPPFLLDRTGESALFVFNLEVQRRRT